MDDCEDPIPAEWISIGGWKDIQSLIEIGDTFRNFINDLRENLSLFKQWYDDEKPEAIELPLQYNKITTF